MRRGAIAAVGYAGVALLAIAGGVRLVVADSGTVALILAVLGLGLFVAYFVSAGEDMTRFLSRRSTREGGNVLGTAFFLLGALGVVNLLGANFRTHLDLTADRLFTLAPETVAALAAARPPAELWVFEPEGSPEREALRELGHAAELAAPGTGVHLIDPDRDPSKAAEFGMVDYGALVQVGERRIPLAGTREEDLVGALLQATRRDSVTVGFLFGHGEAYPEERGPGGLDAAGRMLHRRGMDVRRIDLLTGDRLEAPLDLVVIAGPRTPLAPAEEDSLVAWFHRGGRILLLVDPEWPVNPERLFDAAGLRYVPMFLADPEQPDPEVHIVADYSGHPAVRDLRAARIALALRGVGELDRESGRGDVRTAALVWSGSRTVPVDDPGATPGRRALAAAAETDSTGGDGRLIAVADVDFATNALFGTLGNGDFFLGAVQWLLQEDAGASLRPRDRTDRPIRMTRQQGRALIVVLALFAPVAVLLAGVAVFWRRR